MWPHILIAYYLPLIGLFGLSTTLIYFIHCLYPSESCKSLYSTFLGLTLYVLNVAVLVYVSITGVVSDHVFNVLSVTNYWFLIGFQFTLTLFITRATQVKHQSLRLRVLVATTFIFALLTTVSVANDPFWTTLHSITSFPFSLSVYMVLVNAYCLLTLALCDWNRVHLLVKRYLGRAFKLTLCFVPVFYLDFFQKSLLEHLPLPSGFVFSSLFLYVISILTVKEALQWLWSSHGRQEKENTLEDIVRLYEFSNREKDVYELLVQGQSNKAISEQLFIAESTVKKHVKNMFEKTDTTGRFELIQLSK